MKAAVIAVIMTYGFSNRGKKYARSASALATVPEARGEYPVNRADATRRMNSEGGVLAGTTGSVGESIQLAECCSVGDDVGDSRDQGKGRSEDHQRVNDGAREKGIDGVAP